MGFFSDTLGNIFDLFTTPPLGTLTEKPSRLPYACIKDENGVTISCNCLCLMHGR